MKHAALAVVMSARAALAAGALPVTLEAAEREALAQRVAEARVKHPEAFKRVGALRQGLAHLDRQKRGPLAPVTSWLNGVPDSTWALADALVFSGEVDPALPRTAQVAWQAGLLEALGGRRDVKTEPLLRAALNAPGLAPPVRRAAADALGRVGTDGAVEALTRAAGSFTGADRLAVLQGMGSCRRLAITALLAQLLARATSEAEQLVLVKALSVNGNRWALETPRGAPRPAEVPRLRSAAAGALVRVYVSSSGRLKTEARDALRVVEAPDTLVLLAQSRALDPAGVDALLGVLAR
ncbi:MAG: HEAT repeat domain-containing protein [Myxococcaceae bacterium]|nr:HEAT repeat domain-containing protein [Myxococcaceae bacterium]